MQGLRRLFCDPHRRECRIVLGNAVLAWIVLGVVLCPGAKAGTGTRASLPTGRVKSGLRVNVDTTWVDANGYRPVQVELISWPPGPAPADRSIRIECKPYNWRGGYAWWSITDFVEIPQGTPGVTATLSIPQREQWNAFYMEFYEDGRKLEDLSYQGGMMTAGNYGWSEASPAMLFIDRDAPPRALRPGRIADLRQAGSKADSHLLPDVRGLAEIYAPPDLTQTGYTPDESATDLTILDSLLRWSKIEILPPSDLPTNWINWTGFDLVFISLEDLRDMTRQNPETWQALRDLIATGPTLCVYGVGQDFEKLAKVEEILKSPPLPDADQALYRGWRTPHSNQYTRVLREAPTNNNQYWYAQQATAEASMDQKTLAALDSREHKPPEKPTFVWRPVDLGRVVAIAAENPFPGRPQDWGWMLNTLDSDDWMWYRRHGLSLSRRNLDYWEFLIPGVGLAPVNSFLVLISLFVVVIGPLNYWFLVRQGRLYLLLLTVPAGAMVVTLSLVGYALVTDGLGVKSRVRSYTEIDQRRGRSVSWSRQSYYASLVPSRGLEFPETAAVYPIEVQPDQPNYYDSKYLIDWEYGQTLAKGYLASRVTSQMMVVQARESSSQIEIKENASGAPQVRNRLGAPVEFLVLRDSEGDFFSAENLADGQTETLSPMKWADAADRFAAAFKTVRPSNPEGYDPRQHNEALNFGQSGNYWYYGNIDSTHSEPNVASSILERSLRRLISNNADALTPRSYAALVPHSPEVPMGIEQTQQLQSIHVIAGKW
jgi:hypothetical protein